MNAEVTQQGHHKQLRRERYRLVCQIDKLLEKPMIVLGFIWLILVILEFVYGSRRRLNLATTTIWIIFIIDFVVRLLISPSKTKFLGKNWLTALSLVAPALRIFRIARAFSFLFTTRALGMVRLVRVVSTINRGMQALRHSMTRVGLPLVLGITSIILFAGAAGMYGFENKVPEGKIKSYADALWWTAMMLTTSGSDYWPQTPEGRILCFLIALYAFAVFSYIAGSLASFFIGQATQKSKPNHSPQERI
jgi:voltage-gated potassium channel